MTRTRKIRPRDESRKEMRPLARDAFHALLNKAIKTTAPKHATK